MVRRNKTLDKAIGKCPRCGGSAGALMCEFANHKELIRVCHKCGWEDDKYTIVCGRKEYRVYSLEQLRDKEDDEIDN